jgi:hypothetical protein
MADYASLKVGLSDAAGFIEVIVRETALNPWSDVELVIVTKANEDHAPSLRINLSRSELIDIGHIIAAAVNIATPYH